MSQMVISALEIGEAIFAVFVQSTDGRMGWLWLLGSEGKTMER